MTKVAIKKAQRNRRHKRVRAKIVGTGERPRLSVYKSNKALYGQIIDDEKGITLASAQTDTKIKTAMKEKSYNAGKSIAQVAKKKNITRVVFDRGGFVYTGNIEAFALGAREGGLSF